MAQGEKPSQVSVREEEGGAIKTERVSHTHPPPRASLSQFHHRDLETLQTAGTATLPDPLPLCLFCLSSPAPATSQPTKLHTFLGSYVYAPHSRWWAEASWPSRNPKSSLPGVRTWPAHTPTRPPQSRTAGRGHVRPMPSPGGDNVTGGRTRGLEGPPEA